MTSPRLFALGSRFVPATCLSLALGVSAALACPGLALADAPPQAPTATPAGSGTAALPPSGTAAQPPALPPSDTAAQPPSGGDAQPPSGAQTPAPATAPPKELPASVLAMQGKDVVLRLDEGPAVVGRLESVNNQVFYVRDPTGAINGIPRSRVRGIRLSEVQSAPAPNYYSGTPNSYSGAPNYTGAPYYSPEPSQGAPGDPQFPHRERSIGFGTAFGGGFSGSGRSVNGAILFPTAELQIFLPKEYSIDVSMPVLNMALSSALLGGFVFGTDLYFNVNAGKGRVRFVGGPGLGIAYAQIGYQDVAVLKIPAQLGFEVLNKKRSFGFKMIARPWLEVPVGGSASADTGGGMLAVFAFSGYALSDRHAE